MVCVHLHGTERSSSRLCNFHNFRMNLLLSEPLFDFRLPHDGGAGHKHAAVAGVGGGGGGDDALTLLRRRVCQLARGEQHDAMDVRCCGDVLCVRCGALRLRVWSLGPPMVTLRCRTLECLHCFVCVCVQ